jgi:cytochrome d ubiquinol oxidase subunit I
MDATLSGAMTALADSGQVLPARQMMAFTLGFHIILVPFGVAFTAIMLIANYRGIRHDDPQAMLLARRWSQVAGVLFAVGAVSGTVLSFELGLLWPQLMGRYGAAFGIPFAVEGLFFFLEAIFVAIYIYGWERMRPWPHFWSGVPIVLSGIGGTSSVVAANGWLNQPGGITEVNGRVVDVRPLEVFFNDAFWYEAIHMLLAAYMVAGFIIAGVYAVAMLRGHRDRLRRLGLAIPFTVAAIATPLQFVVGDVAAREVFHDEPVKFAAIEALPTTETRVPEVLGGVLVDGEVRYGIEVPLVASMLAGFSPDTEIQGLNAFPAEDRPTDRLVNTVHLAFQVMVGIGTALLGLTLWAALGWWRRRRLPENRPFLLCTAVSGVAALVALEAGWVVTEVGRQPWTVVGLLRTEHAAQTAGNLWPFFLATVLLYASIAYGTFFVLRLLRRRWREAEARHELDPGGEGDVPYGPSKAREEARS